MQASTNEQPDHGNETTRDKILRIVAEEASQAPATNSEFDRKAQWEVSPLLARFLTASGTAISGDAERLRQLVSITGPAGRAEIERFRQMSSMAARFNERQREIAAYVPPRPPTYKQLDALHRELAQQAETHRQAVVERDAREAQLVKERDEAERKRRRADVWRWAATIALAAVSTFAAVATVILALL